MHDLLNRSLVSPLFPPTYQKMAYFHYFVVKFLFPLFLYLILEISASHCRFSNYFFLDSSEIDLNKLIRFNDLGWMIYYFFYHKIFFQVYYKSYFTELFIIIWVILPFWVFLILSSITFHVVKKLCTNLSNSCVPLST